MKPPLTTAFAWLKTRPRVLAGLQIAAVIALLAFLGYEFSDAVRDAWPRLRNADLKLVALAHVLLAAYYLLFVLGWQSILRAYGIRLGYRAVLGAEMLSMLAKYIPGGVWTPAARVVAEPARGRRQHLGRPRHDPARGRALGRRGRDRARGQPALRGAAWMRPCGRSSDSPCSRLGLLHPRVFAPLATRASRRFGGSVIEPLPWGTAIGVLIFYASRGSSAVRP